MKWSSLYFGSLWRVLWINSYRYRFTGTFINRMNVFIELRGASPVAKPIFMGSFFNSFQFSRRMKIVRRPSLIFCFASLKVQRFKAEVF
jgi:hypothetical protein